MHYIKKPLQEGQLTDSFSISSSEEKDLATLCSELLLNGIVVFEFLKSDGETKRRAIGTTSADFIPKFDEKKVQTLIEESRDFLVGFNTDTLIQGDDEKLSKAIDPFLPKEKKERKQNLDIQRYYDFEAKGWRSFKKESLIAIYK